MVLVSHKLRNNMGRPPDFERSVSLGHGTLNQQICRQIHANATSLFRSPFVYWDINFDWSEGLQPARPPGGSAPQAIALFHGQMRTSTARRGLPRPDRRQPKKKQCNPFREKAREPGISQWQQSMNMLQNLRKY